MRPYSWAFFALFLYSFSHVVIDYASAGGAADEPPMPPGSANESPPQPPADDAGEQKSGKENAGGSAYQHKAAPQPQYKPKPQGGGYQGGSEGGYDSGSEGGYQGGSEPSSGGYGKGAGGYQGGSAGGYGGGSGQSSGGYGKGGGQASYGGGGGYVPPPPFPIPPPPPMSCDIDPKCWQYAVDCSAADIFPFERHACGSCEECLQLCMKYANPNPPAPQLGCGGGGGCPQQQRGYGGSGCGGGGGCPQQQQGYGGSSGGSYGGGGGSSYGGGSYQGGRRTRDAAMGAVATGGAASGSACGGGPCPYYCQSVVFDAQYKTCDLFTVNSPKLKKYPGRAYFQSTGLCRNNGTAAPSLSCPAGQTAKLIAVKDYQLSGFTGKDAAGVSSDDACAKACLTGQLPDGSAVTCKSAQFTGGKCQISDQEGKPSSDVKPGDGTYYKRYCFPSDLVKDCPDIWDEDPQKVLVGQNRLTVDADTYDKCLLACLNSAKENGFTCKSGMFFFQENTLNCILNVESKSTRPDLFTDAAEGDIVVYFDPNCGGSTGTGGSPSNSAAGTPAPSPAAATPASGTRAHKKKTRTLAEALRDLPLVGDWAMWTQCKGTWLTQSRFRVCRELDPRKCEKEERPCDQSQRTTSTSTSEETSTFANTTVTDQDTSTTIRKRTTTIKSTKMITKVPKSITTTTHKPSTPKTTSPTTVPKPTSPKSMEETTPGYDAEEDEQKATPVGRLVDKNEVRRADAAADDATCRAVVRNGLKNCHLGVRIVGGLKRYCSKPVDC